MNNFFIQIIVKIKIGSAKKFRCLIHPEALNVRMEKSSKKLNTIHEALELFVNRIELRGSEILFRL